MNKFFEWIIWFCFWIEYWIEWFFLSLFNVWMNNRNLSPMARWQSWWWRTWTLQSKVHGLTLQILLSPFNWSKLKRAFPFGFKGLMGRFSFCGVGGFSGLWNGILGGQLPAATGMGETAANHWIYWRVDEGSKAVRAVTSHPKRKRKKEKRRRLELAFASFHLGLQGVTFVKIHSVILLLYLLFRNRTTTFQFSLNCEYVLRLVCKVIWKEYVLAHFMANSFY